MDYLFCRWLSHLRAVVRFVERYEVILDTMDTLITETKDPEIVGIRSKVTNTQYVFTILLLADILKPVNMLSLYLQSDIGYFTNLPDRVKACVHDIHEIIRQYQQGDMQDLEFRYYDILSILYIFT